MRKHALSENQNAFTLVELLIVLFMMGLVITSIYSLFVVHQRSAHVQDDVVDVQQNLHVSMDTLVRDIQLAGFVLSQERQPTGSIESMVVSADNQNGNTVQSIRAAFDLQANYAGLLPLTDDAFSTQPQRIHADRMDLNFGTALSSCATVTFGPLVEKMTFADLGGVFPVSRARDLDPFSANPPLGTLVRVIRPREHVEVTNMGPGEFINRAGPGTCFNVTGLNPGATPPTMTIAVDNTRCGGNINPNTAPAEFRNGDQICPQTGAAYPNTVTYCLGPDNLGQCPVPGGTVCNQGGNDQTLCLMRIDNIGTPSQSAQVLATRISGLQFSYLLDDDTEVPNNVTPIGGAFSALNQVRAVRITLTGQTARAMALERAAQEKTRTLTSIVKLRNRFTWL